MTLTEKIKHAASTETLILFKEGIFYKLYNQGAMLFVSNIKNYKITIKYIKYIKQDVFSIGFPITSFDKPTKKEQLSIAQRLQNRGAKIDTKDNVLEINHIQWENIPDYEPWCELQKEKQLLDNKTTNTTNSEIADLKKRILDFNIANKTPMQAFEFVIELQKQLR